MNYNILLSGSIWTSASTIIAAIVQILRLSILTNFLEKNDFGVVAILTMFLGFTNTFSELGFSTVIIHKQNLTEKEFSSLYWIQYILYAIIYILFSSISYYVAIYFNEPTITYLLPITMLDLLLYGLGRLYDTIMQKDLRFNVLAQRNIVASVISLITAVLLAYYGAGVYSLIISTLVQTLIVNVWNFIQGRKYISLKLYCSYRLVKPLFNIGLFQTGSNILDYISTKIDIFIIGKYLGSEALGIYNLAKELILKGSMLVNSIVNRISLPLFAKRQDEKDFLCSNYKKLISFIALINIPICTIIGALGYIIIPIIYGEKYIDVVPILYIISIWGIFNCIGNPVSNIVIATGKTFISFKYTVIRILCYIPCMLILSKYSITILAWGTTILTATFIFISWYMLLYKLINMGLKLYLKSFIIPLIYSLVIGAIAYSTLHYCYIKNVENISMLLISIFWGILYLIIYLYLEKYTIYSLIKILKLPQ